MPASTPRGYTHATSDDANDVPLVTQRLAEQIDADVQRLYDIPQWTPVTFAANYGSYPNNTARYRASREEVRLEGLFARLTGTPTVNEVIATGLPAPDAGQELIIGTTSGTGAATVACSVGVTLAGELRWKGGNYSSYGSLYGLSYPRRLVL